MNSAFTTLSKRDFWNGVLMAVLTPVIGYVYQIVTSGSLEMDWAKIGTLALSGFVGYIFKNYFSDSEGHFLGIGTTDPTVQ